MNSFGYTSLGRLKTATNLESGTLTYSYDNSGNVKSITKGDTVTTIQYDAYDGLNRPRRKSHSGTATPEVKYCYDGQVATAGGNCGAESPGIPNSIDRKSVV